LSPTDDFLSPVSKQMKGLKKTASASDMRRREKRRVPINLHKEIPPLPFPPNTIDFIFGTSSTNRREVMDILQWKYVQMSPNIDGKRILFQFSIEDTSIMILSPHCRKSNQNS
jgi:hypothetical protein